MSEDQPPNPNLTPSVSQIFDNIYQGPSSLGNVFLAVLYRNDSDIFNMNSLFLRNHPSVARERSARHSTPYPVHAHTLSAQHREAERRRAAMTLPSSRSNNINMLQMRAIRLPPILRVRRVPILRNSPSRIDALTFCKSVLQDDTSDSCVICQSQFEMGQCIRVLLCNHKFHKHCIDEWFKNSINCCICRKGLDGLPYQREEVMSPLSVVIDAHNEYDGQELNYQASASSGTEDVITID